MKAITPLPGSSSSSSTTTTSTQRTPLKNGASPTGGNAPPIMSQTSNIVPRIAPDTVSTTTSRPKLPQEDFPPLGPPRRQNSVSSTTPSTTTLNSVWATPPTPSNSNGQNVQFIPNPPNPSIVAPTPINIPQIEIASNSELEILTEELFNKETSSLFDKLTINYQGRTQSSATTDEAPMP